MGQIRRFTIKPKRKKNRRTESIKVPGGAVKPRTGKIYPSWTKSPLFDPKDFPTEAELHERHGNARRTCTIHKDARQQFWLLVPVPIENRERIQPTPPHEPTPETQGSIVALDPGVRTFLCGYSPTEHSVREYGRNDFGRIWRLCMHADLLRSSIDRTQGHPPKRKIRAWHKLYRRITNLVKEAHRKIALDLCRRYEHIILPPFSVKGMTTKKGPRGRRIGKKTARMMYSWAPYRFRQWLLHKGREFGTKVYIRGEHWTSKTCTRCLRVTHTQSKSNQDERVFQCSHQDCAASFDRDVNGARNILLRNCRFS